MRLRNGTQANRQPTKRATHALYIVYLNSLIRPMCSIMLGYTLVCMYNICLYERFYLRACNAQTAIATEPKMTTTTASVTTTCGAFAFGECYVGAGCWWWCGNLKRELRQAAQPRLYNMCKCVRGCDLQYHLHVIWDMRHIIRVRAFWAFWPRF